MTPIAPRPPDNAQRTIQDSGTGEFLYWDELLQDALLSALSTVDFGSQLGSIESAINTLQSINSGGFAFDFATEATQQTLLTEAEWETRIGEVSASPTTNTVMDRLKRIEDGISTLASASFQDFFLEVSKGNIPGHKEENVFGRNPDIDIASVPETVWEAGGVYPFPTAAAVLNLESDNAADAAAGTGARSVQVIGLNASYVETSEIVALNGVTPVPTVNTYLRVNDLFVITTGSGAKNAGIIRARHTGTVVARINAGMNRTTMAVFTIPAGKSGYIHKFIGTVNRGGGGSGQTADMSFFVRPFGLPFYRNATVGLDNQGGQFIAEVKTPIRVTEKSDIKLEVDNVSNNDTDASAGFFMVLVDD